LTCVDDSRTYKVAFSREFGSCEKRTLDVPFNIQCSNFLDLERGGPVFEIEFGLGCSFILDKWIAYGYHFDQTPMFNFPDCLLFVGIPLIINSGPVVTAHQSSL
jgi:hypothetical protein